jgi:hypothetical protein
VFYVGTTLTSEATDSFSRRKQHMSRSVQDTLLHLRCIGEPLTTALVFLVPYPLLRKTSLIGVDAGVIDLEDKRKPPD